MLLVTSSKFYVLNEMVIYIFMGRMYDIWNVKTTRLPPVQSRTLVAVLHWRVLPTLTLCRKQPEFCTCLFDDVYTGGLTAKGIYSERLHC